MDRRFMFMESVYHQGIVCPCPRGYYIHEYDHNIQTSSALVEVAWQIKAKLNVEHR